MLKKITSAEARKRFSDIVNQVAFGNNSFILTRRGKPIAAIISLEELRLLQELEEKADIRDAWKAKEEPGEPVPWEDVRRQIES